MIRIIGLYSPAQGSGKTTMAEAIELVPIGGVSFVRVPFAGPLKAMMRALLVEAGAGPDEIREIMAGSLKESPTPFLVGRSARQAMQWLGTEWGRNLMDQDFWIEIWKRRVATELARGYGVVADDVRFPNEAETVRSLQGLMVSIERPGQVAAGQHTSEGGLARWPFDLTLSNNFSTQNDWMLRSRHAVERAIYGVQAA